jgi:hypothetical protein
MTEDASRNRRNKRKPSSFMEEASRYGCRQEYQKRNCPAKKEGGDRQKVVVKKNLPKSNQHLQNPNHRLANGKQPTNPKGKAAETKPKRVRTS